MDNCQTWASKRKKLKDGALVHELDNSMIRGHITIMDSMIKRRKHWRGAPGKNDWNGKLGGDFVENTSLAPKSLLQK